MRGEVEGGMKKCEGCRWVKWAERASFPSLRLRRPLNTIINPGKCVETLLGQNEGGENVAVTDPAGRKGRTWIPPGLSQARRGSSPCQGGLGEKGPDCRTGDRCAGWAGERGWKGQGSGWGCFATVWWNWQHNLKCFFYRLLSSLRKVKYFYSIKIQYR